MRDRLQAVFSGLLARRRVHFVGHSGRLVSMPLVFIPSRRGHPVIDERTLAGDDAPGFTAMREEPAVNAVMALPLGNAEESGNRLGPLDTISSWGKLGINAHGRALPCVAAGTMPRHRARVGQKWQKLFVP